MKKILFYAYPTYVDFEIAHTLFFLRKLGNASITTATINGRAVESLGGLITQAQIALTEVNPEVYDLVLISGGDHIGEIAKDGVVQRFLQKVNSMKVPIAAICGSSVLLAKAGLLLGKRFTCTNITYNKFTDLFDGAEYTGSQIEVLEDIITAKGTAFPEFTIAVIDKLGLWKNEEQRQGALLFCKGEV
jgi:putative intracellular protease/amidase